MAYLTLSGITVAVDVRSVSMSYADVGGEMERSPSGELSGGLTAYKREWRMSTTPVPVSEVDAWVGLIEGRGHSWPFDADLYSSRGRGTYSGTASLTAVDEKWGAKSLSALTGVTDVRWNAGLGSAWTLAWWSKNLGDVLPVWTHWMLRSDGAVWQNGVSVAEGTSTGEVAVSGSLVVITGADGSDFYVDDVVAMPFAVPDSWPAALYAEHNARAWATLPRVRAAGDFAPSAVTVRGKVTGSKVIRYANAGALTAGHMLDFTLREV